MSKLKKIDDNNFESVVSQTDQTIVKFGAEWCGPCKMILPELEEIVNDYGHINIFEVDIDDKNSENIVAKFDVKMVPTLIFFKNGKEVERTMGYKPKDVIIEIANKYAK